MTMILFQTTLHATFARDSNICILDCEQLFRFIGDKAMRYLHIA